MVRVLLYILIILGLESCVLDQKITMVQTKNDTHALRLDGIYLHEDSLNIVDLLYLYQDGTILSRGSVPKIRLESKLTALDHSKDEKYKSKKFLWGSYMISGDIIKFEKWGTSDKPYRTFIRKGQILNDTTFVIDTYYPSKSKHSRKIFETFRFKAMSSKPDSINRWVGIRN